VSIKSISWGVEEAGA